MRRRKRKKRKNRRKKRKKRRKQKRKKKKRRRKKKKNVSGRGSVLILGRNLCSHRWHDPQFGSFRHSTTGSTDQNAATDGITALQ